jgi:predicted RNA-binding protein with PUA-like domain
MNKGHWLVKQEPDSYSWDDFRKEGRTRWEGVRNYQARNNLKAMQVGDPVLFYASGDSKSVMGVASVCRAAYPDPTADEPGWVAVDLKAVSALDHPVPLARIKADPALSGILLVRNSRLSVMPLPREAYKRIVGIGISPGASRVPRA